MVIDTAILERLHHPHRTMLLSTQKRRDDVQEPPKQKIKDCLPKSDVEHGVRCCLGFVVQVRTWKGQQRAGAKVLWDDTKFEGLYR